MTTPEEWARECLYRVELAGAEASASEVVAVIVREAVAEERERCAKLVDAEADVLDRNAGHPMLALRDHAEVFRALARAVRKVS